MSLKITWQQRRVIYICGSVQFRGTSSIARAIRKPARFALELRYSMLGLVLALSRFHLAVPLEGLSFFKVAFAGRINKSDRPAMMLGCPIAYVPKETLRSEKQHQMLVLVACQLDHRLLCLAVSILSQSPRTTPQL
jgi:hypothetical protein